MEDSTEAAAVKAVAEDIAAAAAAAAAEEAADGAALPVVLAGAAGSPAASIGVGGGPESLPNTPASASMNDRFSCSGQTSAGTVPLRKYSV